MKQINNPWAWVPTLYFAEGLPYVAVNILSVIMYKNLGLSNTQIAFYTSWLYFPWVIKPFWSPFVDMFKTKRFWVIAMQLILSVGFAGVAFTIPSSSFVKFTMAFFWLMAFSSATHDIAADGFYMLGLTDGEQSFFVGIRNTAYRVAMIFGQGLIVMFVGLLYEGRILPHYKGDYALSWTFVFFLMASLFIALFLYHSIALPKPKSDKPSVTTSSEIFEGFANTFSTFFSKKHIWMALLFVLTYRLGESQLTKIASPFLLDTLDKGGLQISTAMVGAIYGTFGVVALLVGGILGGILISRDGLKRWLIPMALMINVPDILYVIMAFIHPGQILVTIFVMIEQFGYGLGFTAFTMYLIYIVQGAHKTAHYAFATGFMALGMMLPGMASGWIQEQTGYPLFFVLVCLFTIPGIIMSFVVKKQIQPDFGKK